MWKWKYNLSKYTELDEDSLKKKLFNSGAWEKMYERSQINNDKTKSL